MNITRSAPSLIPFSMEKVLFKQQKHESGKKEASAVEMVKTHQIT